MPIKALLVGGGFAIAGCGGTNVENTAEHIGASNTPVAAGNKPGHPSALHKAEHPSAAATPEAPSASGDPNVDQYAAALQGGGSAYAHEGGQTAEEVLLGPSSALRIVMEQRGLTEDQAKAVLESDHTLITQATDTHLNNDDHTTPIGATDEVPQGEDLQFRITP
jgi:hypothetical protein